MGGTAFSSFMLWILANSASGEVVLYRETTGTTSLQFGATGVFAVSQGLWNITGIRLFGQAGGSVVPNGLRFQLRDGNNNPLTSASEFFGTTISASGTLFEFNQGPNPISNYVVSNAGGGIYQLQMDIGTNGLPPFGMVLQDGQALINNPIPGIFGLGQFTMAWQLEATAVPEPTTLALGTIATISGGAGVWWKRRKKVSTQNSPV